MEEGHEGIRRRPGRPPLYEGGMVVFSLRLPVELVQWVRDQGGQAYVRRLIEEDRQNGQA